MNSNYFNISKLYRTPENSMSSSLHTLSGNYFTLPKEAVAF